MIKEAIEMLLEEGRKQQNVIVEHMGVSYLMNSKGLERITVPKLRNPITVNTLSSLITYINEKIDKDLRNSEYPLLVDVVSPEHVRVVSQVYDFDRITFLEAKAILPRFQFEKYYDMEEFIIKIQACFEKTEDVLKILQICGNIKEENIKTVGDNGITQGVTVKQGIAMVQEMVVPNPVLLRPYRTFIEVGQPESAFIFRMQDGPRAALFEADGGAWRIEATEFIRQDISEKLEKGLAIVLV